MDNVQQKTTLHALFNFCLYGLALTLPLSIAISSIFYFGLLGLYVLTGMKSFRWYPPVWGGVEKAFCVFYGVTLIAALSGVSLKHSLRDLGDDLYFLMIVLVGATLTRGLIRKRLLHLFLIGSFISALIGVIQHTCGISHFDHVGGPIQTMPKIFEGLSRSIIDPISMVEFRCVGTRSHPLTYAEGMLPALATTMSSVMLQQGSLLWGVLSTWVLGAGIVFSQSRGPWLAAGVMVLLLFVLSPEHTRVRRGLLLLPVLFIFMLPRLQQRASSIISSKANSERLDMWKAGWEMIKDRPLLGVGPRNVRRVVKQHQSERYAAEGPWSHLHNTFINIAAERGLLGLGAFLWLLFQLVRPFISVLRHAEKHDVTVRLAATAGLLTWASFIVSGFTETNYNDVEILMTFYFMMGVFLSTVRKTPAHESD